MQKSSREAVHMVGSNILKSWHWIEKEIEIAEVCDYVLFKHNI